VTRVFDQLPVLKRAILKDHSIYAALVWSALAVLAPLVLRIALDRGNAGVPFTTFYPAIMLAALILGWRWGVIVTLASAVAANRLLMQRPLEVVEVRDLPLVFLFFVSCAMLVATAELARKLVRQMEVAKNREEMLKHELLHRVKNMLATVGAMAAMTARHSPPEDYRTALTGRLDALQRATALLGADVAVQQNLVDVLESALSPFRTPDNMTMEGPPCLLPITACIPLSLALHELCTNAIKHGALSVPEGRVDIRWQVDPVAGVALLDWVEHGGPPVLPPTRKGMGTQLLRRQRELGDVQIIYASSGLTCRMAIAAATLPA